MTENMELSPIGKSSVPFSWEDSDEEEAVQDGAMANQEISCFGCLYGWGPFKATPHWLRIFINTFLVCILLLLPGAIDYTIDAVSTQQTNFNSLPSYGKVIIGGIPLVSWSMLVSGAYAFYYFCVLLVFLLPTVVVHLAQLLTGSLPRHYDIYVGYCRDLRLHLANFLFSLVVAVTWYNLFRPDLVVAGDQNNTWRVIIFQAFATTLAASVFILCQKFLVEIIAVRFHRTAYMERLKTANYVADALSHLHTTAKKLLKRKAQLLAFEVKRQRNHFQASEPTLSRHNWKKAFLSASGETKNAKPAVSQDDTLLPTPQVRTHKSNISFSDIRAMPIPIHRSKSIDDAKSRENHDEVVNSVSSDPLVLPLFSTTKFLRISKTELQPVTKQKTQESASFTSSSEAYAQKLFSRLVKQIAHVRVEVSSSMQAKKVARRIFEALSPETADYVKMAGQLGETDPGKLPKSRATGVLVLQDFLPFFATREEAQRAFEIFDLDGDHAVTRQEMKETCVQIQRDRKALSASLRDVGSAISKLDHVLTVVAVLISLLTGLAIFGISLGTFLLTSVSLLLAVTFIFGNSAKNMFEGIIFLFIVHPFDVGDRVFVDTQNLIVKELGILVTVFSRWDGQLIYTPNSVLMLKDITNIRRSPNQLEVIEIQIAFDTPPEKLTELRRKLNDFLQQESKEYVPKIELQPIEIQNLNKLRIQLFLEYRTNWQDSDKRYARRNKFMFFLKQTLQDLGIGYQNNIQPVSLDMGRFAEKLHDASVSYRNPVAPASLF